MTDVWEISLFDEEPTVYGPKPRDITKGISNKALAHSPTKGNSWGDSETKIMYENPNGAPPLDWWNVSEEEVHRRLILSMCPERVCRTCGEPSRRITESERIVEGRVAAENDPLYHPGRASSGGGDYARNGNYTYGKRVTTIGWTDCGHDDWRPGVVLDPFA